MKLNFMIETKCVLCGAQAEVEETVDRGAYNTTERKEMTEMRVVAVRIKKRPKKEAVE